MNQSTKHQAQSDQVSECENAWIGKLQSGMDEYHSISQSLRKALVTTMLMLPALFGTGCATHWQTASLAVGATTAVGGQAPTHEVQQTYYLGIFDPEEQVPQQVYRLRVHGQSSLLSMVRFASGWVPAPLVDSLSSTIGFDSETGKLKLNAATDSKETSALESGKRMVLFGPEGSRKAPKDHRLVIVMSSNTSKYFDTISSTLANVAQFQSEADQTQTIQKLMLELSQRSLEREKLERLKDQFQSNR